MLLTALNSRRLRPQAGPCEQAFERVGDAEIFHEVGAPPSPLLEVPSIKVIGVAGDDRLDVQEVFGTPRDQFKENEVLRARVVGFDSQNRYSARRG